MVKFNRQLYSLRDDADLRFMPIIQILQIPLFEIQKFPPC